MLHRPLPWTSSRRRPLSALLPLLIAATTLSACFIAEPSSPPLLTRAEAGCLTDNTTATDYWYIDATVLPDDGRSVEDVWVDAKDPGPDTYLGSIELQNNAGNHWEASIDSSVDFLDCDWPFAYGFTFYAEDDLANRTSLYLEN